MFLLAIKTSYSLCNVNVEKEHDQSKCDCQSLNRNFESYHWISNLITHYVTQLSYLIISNFSVDINI